MKRFPTQHEMKVFSSFNINKFMFDGEIFSIISLK